MNPGIPDEYDLNDDSSRNGSDIFVRDDDEFHVIVTEGTNSYDTKLVHRDGPQPVAMSTSYNQHTALVVAVGMMENDVTLFEQSNLMEEVA